MSEGWAVGKPGVLHLQLPVRGIRRFRGGFGRADGCIPVPIWGLASENRRQIRPFLALPKEHRVACWKEIVAETVSAEVTSIMVSQRAKQHAEFHRVEVLRGTPAKVDKGSEVSILLGKLRAATFDHVNDNQISRLLDELEELIE